MNSKETELSIDQYSYHEAIDRAWVILSTLETILGEHSVVQNNPEAKKLYEKAVDSLADLYQVLGSLDLNE